MSLYCVIQIKDVESGKDLDDELNMVKFTSIAWTHDGKGFFYQVLTYVVLCGCAQYNSNKSPEAKS